MRARFLSVAGILGLVSTLLALHAPSAAACGGFFCTTVPVDQSAERIIFTVDPGRIGTYVQINYTGSPDDFAWVLPVPSVPQITQADMATFTELDRLTTPVYIPPPAPDCLRPRVQAAAAPSAASGAGVTVLGGGVVGPFEYVVVTSPDPGEMVRWLRDNGYRIDPEMEPLVKVYTDDGMAFVAMKLRPGRDTRDITPIKLTYDSSKPMIPLRLTAVAAQPDMPVLVWIFADQRTSPTNYVDMAISDGEVAFNPFGANNYRQTVARAADQAGGRAFVTELAGPTSRLRVSDPGLQALTQRYPYLTRFYTRISPDEMTVDPVFDLAPGLTDVSNVHDLTRFQTPFSCTDDPNTFKTIPGAGPPPPASEAQRYLARFLHAGAPGGVLLVGLFVGSVAVLRRRSALAMPAGLLNGPRGLLAGLRARRFFALDLTMAGARLLFLEALVLQGVHEAEHVVQVVQRFGLGIRNGSGLLGSIFDVEPVHLLYNLAYLALLIAVWRALRRHRAWIPCRPDLVIGLLGLTVGLESYHTIEHVVKMAQYLQTGLNGTPGILGAWFNVVWLHFYFNTIVYVPTVAAFFLGGFHRAVGRDMRRLWRRAA
jgi:hypothetical protein